MRYLAAIIFMILYRTTEARALPLTISKTIEIPVSNKTSVSQKAFTTYLVKLKPRDIANVTGRKLKLKERIAFLFIQHKIKKQLNHPAENNVKDNGKLAFILGLIGLVCLFVPFLDIASIPLAILAIVIGNKAKREDPYNKKARTGITLGIVTLGLLVIVGFTVAIVLTIGSVPR